MNKTLDDYIKKLPPYIGKEIFKFIIQDSHNIKFRHYSKYNNYYYSPRYTVACIKNKFIESMNETYLSRISKKNGKHKYYLSNEYKIVYCDGCGEEYSSRCIGCKVILNYEYSYKNKYIGTDLDKALLELYLEDK